MVRTLRPSRERGSVPRAHVRSLHVLGHGIDGKVARVGVDTGEGGWIRTGDELGVQFRVYLRSWREGLEADGSMSAVGARALNARTCACGPRR